MLFLPVHILHLPKRKPRLQRKSWLHRVFPQGAKILKHVEAKKKFRLPRRFPHSAHVHIPQCNSRVRLSKVR